MDNHVQSYSGIYKPRTSMPLQNRRGALMRQRAPPRSPSNQRYRKGFEKVQIKVDGRGESDLFYYIPYIFIYRNIPVYAFSHLHIPPNSSYAITYHLIPHNIQY